VWLQDCPLGEGDALGRESGLLDKVHRGLLDSGHSHLEQTIQSGYSSRLGLRQGYGTLSVFADLGHSDAEPDPTF
jgi:hypothetical protein